jgi:hypothetical protein
VTDTSNKRLDPESGDKASFVIQIKYLQNSTWQGSIQWLNGKKTQNFRSALEMIKLMDNALGKSEEESAKWE